MSIELSYQDIGSGSPIIILHGLFGSKRNWSAIAKRLSAHHRVLTVDMRNHGDSPWIDGMDYRDMSQDVADFIKRHALGPSTVIGHSMGGKAAMTLALTHPELVARMVVVDIAPVERETGFGAFIDAMAAVPLAACDSRADVEEHLADVVRDKMVRSFLVQNLVRDGASFRWRLNLAALDAGMGEIADFPVPRPPPKLPRPDPVRRRSELRLYPAAPHGRHHPPISKRRNRPHPRRRPLAARRSAGGVFAGIDGVLKRLATVIRHRLAGGEDGVYGDIHERIELLGRVVRRSELQPVAIWSHLCGLRHRGVEMGRQGVAVLIDAVAVGGVRIAQAAGVFRAQHAFDLIEKDVAERHRLSRASGLERIAVLFVVIVFDHLGDREQVLHTRGVDAFVVEFLAPPQKRTAARDNQNRRHQPIKA